MAFRLRSQYGGRLPSQQRMQLRPRSRSTSKAAAPAPAPKPRRLPSTWDAAVSAYRRAVGALVRQAEKYAYRVPALYQACFRAEQITAFLLPGWRPPLELIDENVCRSLVYELHTAHAALKGTLTGLAGHVRKGKTETPLIDSFWLRHVEVMRASLATLEARRPPQKKGRTTASCSKLKAEKPKSCQGERDDVISCVLREGGIRPDDVDARQYLDVEKLSSRESGIRGLVKRKGGRSFSAVAEALHQQGFTREHDEHAAGELVMRAASVYPSRLIGREYSEACDLAHVLEVPNEAEQELDAADDEIRQAARYGMTPATNDVIPF